LLDENGIWLAIGIIGKDFLQPALKKPDLELPGRLPHVERRDRQSSPRAQGARHS